MISNRIRNILLDYDIKVIVDTPILRGLYRNVELDVFDIREKLRPTITYNGLDEDFCLRFDQWSANTDNLRAWECAERLSALYGEK